MNEFNKARAPDTTKVTLDHRVIVPAFGLGRWAPFNWERLPNSTRIRLFWHRTACWLILLVCVVWLLLATALYGYVKYRRGFTEVSFKHMVLLPWKFDDYRRAQAMFNIRKGLALEENLEWRQALNLSKAEFFIKDCFVPSGQQEWLATFNLLKIEDFVKEVFALSERRKWRKAFNLLSVGLKVVPEHCEARLMTARIYDMAGRPDMARSLLIDGLAYNGHRLDYLGETLGYFFGLKADDMVIVLMSELRTRLAGESPAHRMAIMAITHAYFYRDRLDEAIALLREERLTGTTDGRFLMARVDWERGRKEDSLQQLRALAAQVPDDFEIYRTLVCYLNEEGRWSDVRQVALSRELSLPDSPEAYVDYIAACTAEGDVTSLLAAEAFFFEKFANDPKALLKLGELTAHAGRIDVVKKVVACCLGIGREQADAEMLLLLAHLERREYGEVLSATARLSMDSEKWPERQRLVMGGLKAAALYASGDKLESEAWVLRLCETQLLPASLFTLLAEQLDKAGQVDAARRVLRHAVDVDPLHQPALVLFLRSALAAQDLGDTVPLIERLITIRKPPADLLAGLSRGLGSDRYLLLPGRVRVQAEICAKLAGVRQTGNQ